MASRPRRSGDVRPDARFRPELTSDGRSPYQRDRDRILYSGAFARLAETTQVLSPSLGHAVHNRLTHSLKVGQIARRITERLTVEYRDEVQQLGGIDAEAAEAAGFAHDLGHPPFGHIAEKELDELVRAHGVDDGYEGNAQSFRIVTKLAASDSWSKDEGGRSGLNLSRRTLDGILKYPWLFDGNPDKKDKWGAYKTEKGIFDWVRADKPAMRRSLTAEVMDWADDITFAIHDLLDFYCAGRIPIERFKLKGSEQRARLEEGMFRRMPAWLKEKSIYLQCLNQVVSQFRFEADHVFGHSYAEQASLHHFATGLIRHFVGSLSLKSSGVEIEPFAKREVEILKQFTWEYVIENPDLAVAQSGQRRAIREVFQWLLEQATTKQFHRLPGTHRHSIQHAESEQERVRCVCDCVASMTEKQVIRMHGSLLGVETANG